MVARVWFTPSRLGDQRIKMSLYQHIDISTCLYINLSTYRHIDISTMTVPIGLVSTSPYVPFEMESMITDPVRSLLARWTTSLSHGKHHFYGPVTTILGEICPDIYSVIQCFFRVSFVDITWSFPPQSFSFEVCSPREQFESTVTYTGTMDGVWNIQNSYYG